MKRSRPALWIVLAVFAAASAPALAFATGSVAPGADPATPAAQPLVPQLRILALFTLLSLIPAIVLTMTTFTRIVVVLSFVRQGIGSQQTPPNQVIIGLALFLSAFTMSPVLRAVARDAWQPYSAGQITERQALDRAVGPLRSFMLRQTRERDLALFFNVTQQPMPQTEEDVPLTIAAPAFIVSELTTAFQMGVMVLLPFLVIDLLVSSILMSMGMMMVPPATLALPLKLLLFVLADGWHMVVESLARSVR